MKMKIRKKILACFLMVAMAFSTFTIPVLAEDAESDSYITLVSTSDCTEVAAGDTFTVTVALTENTGFVGFLAALDYDSDLLTLTGFSYADTFSGWAATSDETLDGAKMAWSTSDSDSTETGELATMTFTVNDGAYDEVTEVGLDMSSSNSCFDYAFSALEIQQTKAEISIVCNHEWDDGVVTKEATSTEAGEMTYTCTRCGETYTEEIAATGDTGVELQITSQPSDYTGAVGETATFTVEAEGSALSYQWQYLSAGKTVWVNSGMTGSTTATLSVKVTAARGGQKYRCVITDDDGNSVTSDAATLTVSEETPLRIATQPSDYTGTVGETATFTVEAEGTDLSYQWQYVSASGTTWHNSGMTGSATATLSVPITEARDGQKYRCVVTDGDGNSVTSDAAALTVSEETPLRITTQPSDYTGTVGETATFTVEAEGTDLSYQWQYVSASGTTWHNSGMTGSATATLSVTITVARDGQKYRCVVTDGDGNSVTSDAAALTVSEETPLRITTQPSDYTGTVGETATFAVEAEGTDLSYQWQYMSASGITWHNSGMSGATTAVLSVSVTAARDGQKYRCVVTDGDGNSITSDAATLTISAEDSDGETETETESSKLLYTASEVTALTIYSSSVSISAARISAESDISYILGDVDENGAVDKEDVTRLRRYVAGINLSIIESASDINADDSIDLIDVVLIERYVAGVGDNTWGIGDEFKSGSGEESLTLNQTEAELPLGGTLQLEATYSLENEADTDIVWISSDTDIATVSDSGLVLASSSNYGMAVITAQAGSCNAQCTIYVGNMVIFYGNANADPEDDNMQVSVSSSSGTYDVYTYEGGSADDYESAYVACLPDGSYSYTATANGYYASVCAFTVNTDGSVSYTTSWASAVLTGYGLSDLLDGTNATFYLELEEFVPSDNEDAWDGVTLDVSWYTPGEGTYYISKPEQLAGLAAIVNGIYNAEITTIIDTDGTYTPEEYASYSGRKIEAGCSSSNGTGTANEVTSDDYYFSAFGYDFDGETIYLTEDLDMGGYQDDNGNWTGARYMPIGGQYQMHYVKSGVGDGYSHIGASFNGTFDGQGHIVYNIYCDRYSATNFGDSSSVGLIGRLGNHDNDYNTYIGNGNDGGNYPAVSPTVRNVAVDGWIYARRSVGGIVGKTGKTAYNYTDTIKAYSNVTQGSVIENCINFATVTSTDAKGCGGIVGAGWNGGTISNCANFGDITNVSYVTCPVGGISGSNENEIINCYSVGKITALKDSFAMGIGTNNGGASDVQNCYWLTGTASGGGYYNGGADTIADYEVTDDFKDSELSAQDYIVSGNLADDLNDGGGVVWVTPDSEDSIYSFLSNADDEYDYATAPVPRVFTSQTVTAVSLTVSGEPEKLSYLAGETFDTTGLVIYVNWSDNTSEVIEPELSIDRALEATDSEITLSVKVDDYEWSETYYITVVESTVSSMTVSTQPTTRTYNEGDNFDPTGLQVKITYSNGDTVTAAWLEGTTFVDTSDSGEKYTIDIIVESPLTYEGSNGVGVTLSYTYEGTTVTAVTNVLTIVSSSGIPTQNENGVYQVGTAAQLDWVASQVNSGLDPSISFCLTSDITANSDFTPIGSYSTYAFQGTLDGDGHKVTLAIDSTSSYQALFGCTGDGAVIENLIVDGSVSGSKRVAGLIAYVIGDTTLENCGNLADITVSGATAGGLIAYIYYSDVTIQSCFNRGSVTETGTTLSAYGGIVGEAYYSDVVISDCYNQGAISGYAGKNNISHGIGGIIGSTQNSSTSNVITNCYSSGQLTNYQESSTTTLYPEQYVGAIVGTDRNSKAEIDNCYWLEEMSAYDVGNFQTTTGMVTLEELIDLAATLGTAYQSNDGCLPILTWQTVTGHTTDADGNCIYCGTEVSK